MSTRFNPKTFAATLAVSAVALTGAAYAQQGQQQQQQMQQSQQQRAGQSGMQGQSAQAPMEYRQVRGTIVDAKRVNVRGTNKQATLVLLETESGNRAIADLGTERIGIRLREGAELAVRGRPVNIGQQRVILQANAISYEGRAYDVNRPAMRQDRQAMAGGGRQDGQDRQSQQNRQDRQNQSMNRQNQQTGQNQQSRQGGMSGSASLATFDMDGDSALNRREMANALYARWDRDGNGRLSVNEWDRGADRTFGEGAVNLDVQEWDRNDDGSISRGEFRRGVRQAGLFDQVDRNDDGTVSQREFRTAMSGGTGSGTRTGNAQGGASQASYQDVGATLYTTFDRNSDRRLSQSEYQTQASTYFDGEDYFADWDADDSGWLEEEEFTTGIEEAGLFGDWDIDSDGMIAADEWESAGYDSEGLFGDDTGMLGRNDSLIGEDEGVF